MITLPQYLRIRRVLESEGATPRMVVGAWAGMPYKRTRFWWWLVWPFLYRSLKHKGSTRLWWWTWRGRVYRLPASLLDEPTAYYLTLEGNLLKNTAVQNRLADGDESVLPEALAGCVYRLVFAPRVVRQGQAYRLKLWDWSLQGYHLSRNQKAIARMDYRRVYHLFNHLQSQLQAVSKRYSDKPNVTGPKLPDTGFLGTVFGMTEGPHESWSLLQSDTPLLIVLEYARVQGLNAEAQERWHKRNT